jgi:hypothetical protein
MPEERPDSDEPGWLLEPPSPGEVHMNVAIGSEVELSPEARRALETLMSHLQDDEVMGFLPPCGGLDACSNYKCELGKCLPLRKYPCAMDVNCKVGQFF